MMQKRLGHTIQSVISQTCKDFEYIVIDGGSTDGSESIIKNFEPNISYWVSEADHGIYHAMNKGVAQAHGEYCIFLNSETPFTTSVFWKDLLIIMSWRILL